jgi:hypothetical protein
MSLSLDRPVPVVSFSKYPPQGVPIGSHAFVLKMTPEALDELAAQLATQQVGALQNPNALNGRSNDKKKKDDKPVMQLVVGESGQVRYTHRIPMERDCTRSYQPCASSLTH